MLPRKLYDFDGVFNAIPLAGKIQEIVLPPLERKFEEYIAGGMAGPVKIDLGQAGLKIEFTVNENDRDVIKAYGDPRADGVTFRFMGAYMGDGGSEGVEAVEVTVRGRIEKLDHGSAKRHELTANKVEMPLTYYKYSSNGQVLVEIDLLSNILTVNGVDRLAQVRAAIGQR